MKARKLSAKTAELYAQMVRSLPWAMCVVHVADAARESTWRLVAANAQARVLAGRTIEEYSRLSLSRESGLKEPETAVAAGIRAVAETGRAKTLGYAWGRSDLRSPEMLSVRAMRLGESCVGIVLHNVTQSVEAEQNRASAEARLEEVCAAARAIQWTADAETLECRSVTAEAAPILGYWPERWRGEAGFLRNHAHAADWELMRTRCAEAALGGEAEPFDFRMYDHAGKTHWFRAHVRARRTGRKTELSGVMVDVSDQKQNEQEALELSARVMKAQERERKRISRDLHDSVGQHLTALRWQLARTRRGASGDARLEEELKECARMTQVCMEEVRAVSYALHPPALEMLGLGPAVEWQAKRFAEQSGLKVEVEIGEGIPRLGADAEMAVFRVFQECLSNVRRHAKTDAAYVRLRSEGGATQLEVEDRGVGVPAELLRESGQGQGGIGLLKMRERMRDLGGTLEIVSTEQGTLVRASVPRQESPGAGAAARAPAPSVERAGLRRKAARA